MTEEVLIQKCHNLKLSYVKIRSSIKRKFPILSEYIKKFDVLYVIKWKR